MSQWPSVKAKRVLAAPRRIGWEIKRTTGSHRVLARAGWANYVFAFHDDEEIGPRMLSRVARATGLKADDLEAVQSLNHVVQTRALCRTK